MAGEAFRQPPVPIRPDPEPPRRPLLSPAINCDMQALGLPALTRHLRVPLRHHLLHLRPSLASATTSREARYHDRRRCPANCIASSSVSDLLRHRRINSLHADFASTALFLPLSHNIPKCIASSSVSDQLRRRRNHPFHADFASSACASPAFTLPPPSPPPSPFLFSLSTGEVGMVSSFGGVETIPMNRLWWGVDDRLLGSRLDADVTGVLPMVFQPLGLVKLDGGAIVVGLAVVADLMMCGVADLTSCLLTGRGLGVHALSPRHASFTFDPGLVRCSVPPPLLPKIDYNEAGLSVWGQVGEWYVNISGTCTGVVAFLAGSAVDCFDLLLHSSLEGMHVRHISDSIERMRVVALCADVAACLAGSSETGLFVDWERYLDAATAYVGSWLRDCFASCHGKKWVLERKLAALVLYRSYLMVKMELFVGLRMAVEMVRDQDDAIGVEVMQVQITPSSVFGLR